MSRRTPRFVFVFVGLLIVGEVWLISGAGTAVATVDGKYFFTGTPSDQAAKEGCQDPPPAPSPDPITCSPTASFAKTAPTASAPATQEAVPNCAFETVANRRCVFWYGPYTGAIDGPIEFCWWWSSSSSSVPVRIRIWADPDIQAANRVQPDKMIGSADVTFTPGQQPTKLTTLVPGVKGTVKTHLLIQVSPVDAPAGAPLSAQYGSTGMPSAFGPPGTACATSTASPTGTATSPRPSPSPSPTTVVTSPGVRLRVSDLTPARGAMVKATASLRKCAGHQSTDIKLQKRRGTRFGTVATKKLDNTCKAVFRIRANYAKATYRALWPKQDQDHRKGRSTARTIRTHE